MTLRRIVILASAGKGINVPIPAAVSSLCTDLAVVQPTSLVDDGMSIVTVRAQLNQAFYVKTLQVDIGSYGVTSSLFPSGYHAVNPADPTTWDDTGNVLGINFPIYYAGQQFFINVRTPV